MLQMSAAELEAFLRDHFPQLERLPYRVEQVGERALEIRLVYDAQQLRPGGTISGPTLMTLADTAMYLLVLAHIGPVALTVTTNLNINFLRKPPPGDVLAQAQLLKLGARLAVGAVTMYSAGEVEPVAHASVTYSIPPRR
jgi:uncharacterized protein (TIGR00369 family)